MTQDYYGTKRVTAWRQDRPIPNDAPPNAYTEPKEEGYGVKYADGYISWSPKEAFEAAYQPLNALSFGHALVALKEGKRVARAGWNGKGMWVGMKEPYVNSMMTFPYLFISVPDCEEGTRRLPWQPAQVDLFADDWVVVE